MKTRSHPFNSPILPLVLVALAVLLSACGGGGGGGGGGVVLAPGDPDPTFGGNGVVVTPIGTGDDRANAVAIDNAGKIVVGGNTSFGLDNNDFVLARYNADGALDNTFGTGGKTITQIGAGSANDLLNAVAIRPSDNVIVAVGSTFSVVSQNDFAVARYTANGTVIGTTTTAFGTGDDVLSAVTFDNTGRIVAAGHAFNAASNTLDFAVAVYNGTTGALDPAFGGTGVVVTPIGTSDDRATSVGIDNNGKIVVAGFFVNSALNTTDIAVVRYNLDGTLDNNFGTDNTGIVTKHIGRTGSDNNSFANAIAIGKDNTILVVGGASFGLDNNDFVLVRFRNDGTLDNTFGTDNTHVVFTNIGSGTNVANAVALYSDGRIVVAGYATVGGGRDLAVARYNANGTLDGTFGGDGIVTTPVVLLEGSLTGPGSDEVNGLAIQKDGKIVAVGTSPKPGGVQGFNFTVVRLLP